jgi:hypothetical protein
VIFHAPAGRSEPARISIPIQNIGAGLAVIKDAFLEPGPDRRVPLLRVEYEAPGKIPLSPRSRPREIYMSPGGQDRLATKATPRTIPDLVHLSEAASGERGVTVHIRFSDAVGDRLFETVLELRRATKELPSYVLRLRTGPIERARQ